MRTILLDGEANRAIWSCKGASGKLCCFRCLICVRDRNIAARNVGFAHVSECDFGKFIVATDEAISRKVDSQPGLRNQVAQASHCRLRAHDGLSKLLKEVTQFGPWRAELQKLFW